MTNWQSRIITSIEEFETLAPQWDRCLASMARPSVFMGSAWLSAWWRAHGQQRQLMIVLLLRDGDLVAGAPLCSRRSVYYRLPVREVAFVGEPASDRQGFLLEADASEVATRLWQSLGDLCGDFDLLRLEEVPADSPLIAAGSGASVEFSSTLPYVMNPGSWEEFEKRLAQKFKSKMRTREKVFDSWGDWEFDLVTGADVVAEIEELRAVEIESQKGHAGIAFFADDRNVELMRRFAAAGNDTSHVLLSRLRVDGELAGYLLGIVHAGTYHAYNNAFRSRYRKGSLGAWILHRTIRHLFTEGIAEIDFLRGATFLKSKWRPDLRRNVRVVGFARGPKMALMRLAVFRLRPWLKGVRKRFGRG